MTSVHPLEQASTSSTKYKRYVSEVDKALKNFEATSEWPDLISALGKLGKAFQTYSRQYTDIPKVVTVAKRLSQCLNHALPAGVNTKALETCKIVFSILGRGDQLGKHLYLFAVGLFPLMEKCGIKVKSALLDLFDQFLVPLGHQLRPSLPGFIAAVLFAVEEGNEAFYNRAMDLLDRVMENSGPLSFYACLWQAVIGSPAVRLPALIYVNNKFDRRKPAGDQLAVICGGPEHADYMTAALCAAAEDPGQVLIQRYLLDFLCAAIPLNSDHVVQSDLVQILRRCLFVVLRRDATLNRRLYQWLLNRTNESGGLNLGGVEELTDLDFFKTYAVPLIRISVAEFMPLETVEISTQTAFYSVGNAWDEMRDIQIQFTEVRLCRLLHYFLDRPELGMPILNETLLIFLEYACRHDPELVSELQRQCEEVDPSFCFGTFWESLFNGESKLTAADKVRRLDEIRKNFNALLNALEPNFLWKYMGDLFVKLLEPPEFRMDLSDEEVEDLNIEERERRRYTESKRKEHLMLYPLMLVFCVRNAQLDAHGDIRAKFITELLQTLLTAIREHGCDHFSRDNLVALISVCRRLLFEISQSVNVVEPELKSEEDCDASTLTAVEAVEPVSIKAKMAENQELIEICLSACHELLIQVCEWYVSGRERDKTGVLCAIAALLRDFADFPIYCLNLKEFNSRPHLKQSMSSYASALSEIYYSPWLSALLDVIDITPWFNRTQESLRHPDAHCRHEIAVADFDVRARILDFVLYLYVRSTSVLEQHSAIMGRQIRVAYLGGQENTSPKTTTTILLKPFVSDPELSKLEEEGIFRRSAFVLWHCLSKTNESVNAQTISHLLNRLHSRKASELSSDIEEIIVCDLTAQNKLVSGAAAKKFRVLWALNRNIDDGLYGSISPKPWNRAVMVMLGFLTDDLATADRAELRAIAFTWFMECAKHNDLHKILQMLFLMLLTPASARVSIQFVQLDHRITKRQLSSLPNELNAIALATVSGHQTFHHVCRDIDVPLTDRSHCSPTAPWNDFTFIDCTKNNEWVNDLKKHTLLPTAPEPQPSFTKNFKSVTPVPDASSDEPNFLDASLIGNPRTPNDGPKRNQSPPAFIRGHKRTVSDIPQFDQDGDDTSFEDPEEEFDLEEFVHHLLDIVCEEYDSPHKLPHTDEEEDDEDEETFTDESPAKLPNGHLGSTSPQPNGVLGSKSPTVPTLNGIPDSQKPQRPHSIAEDDIAGPLPRIRTPGRSANYSKKKLSSDAVSAAGSTVSAPVLNAISRVPDSIKRIKYGHRRQDSLQETIFSTSTQELRLFDPSELPNLTSDGDSKQPLLDESHAHMLFYAESPRVVDLGRAEKIFRIVSALLRNDSSSSLGRLIVSTMIFTDVAKLAQNPSSSHSVQQLLDALSRHYRHMQGKRFWTEDDSPKSDEPTTGNNNQSPKNQTFLEIFSTVSPEELALSCKCKIAALDCYSELMRVVSDLVSDIKSREFVNFVHQSYRTTRTQRVVISLMLTLVPTPPSSRAWRMPVSVDIAEFNNGPQRDEVFRGLSFALHRSLLNLTSVLVVFEFKLLHGQQNYNNRGILFERIHENRQLYNTPQNRSTISYHMVVELKMFIGVVLNAMRRCLERHELWLNFIINCVPYLDRTLPTFSVVVVDQLCRNIYACVVANFAGLSAISSDYENFDPLASEPPSPTVGFDDYRLPKTDSYSAVSGSTSNTYPANYSMALIEALTTMMHYGLIESSTAAIPFLLMRTSFVNSSLIHQLGGPSYNPQTLGTSIVSHSTTSLTTNMSNMVGSAFSALPGFTNIIGKVFTSTETSPATSTLNPSNDDLDSPQKTPHWYLTKRELTRIFPGVLAILSDVWYFTSHGVQPRTPIGDPTSICALILQFLGPVAKCQPHILVNSAAIVWMSRGKQNTKKESDKPSFAYTNQQKALARLHLKVFSFAEMVNACLDILKGSASRSQSTAGLTTVPTSASTSTKVNDQLPTVAGEVPLLELLHCTMQCLPAAELRSTWASLSVLFNELSPSAMPPRGAFLLFTILTDFVKLCGSQTVIEDRSISRGCQDACQRIADALNQIVGWQLESTTWLKRTLVVKQDNNQRLSDVSPTMEYKSIQGSMASEVSSMKGSRSSLVMEGSRVSAATLQDPNQMSGSVAQLSTLTGDSKKTSTLRSSVKEINNNLKKDPANSTQSLFLLAENLAELVDSVCKSEDKEKLLPTLQSVWGNALPFLKAKSARNVRFFLASSQFLASMSGFNYMRQVWKKATMELLLDTSFFKMDIHALRQWLIVIDNLMTNDKTSFKELLARIPSGTSTGLSNLMTSKEQEYEMRSQALKRMAFVILSSQLDQYTSNLPDIQEKLSDNLRFNSVPVIYAQVFTCYRVMMIRMRPNNFGTIWPVMVTELVQVLSNVEQHLQSATTDELRAPRDEQLLQLFLSACKFLETLCTLPSGYVTQFQMCHWAFVSPIAPDPSHELFIPFAIRLDEILAQKFGPLTETDKEVVSASLCNLKTLTCVQELHPFFHVLASQHRTKAAAVTGTPSQEEQLRDSCYINGTLSMKQAIQRLEQALYVDFADHWQL